MCQTSLQISLSSVSSGVLQVSLVFLASVLALLPDANDADSSGDTVYDYHSSHQGGCVAAQPETCNGKHELHLCTTIRHLRLTHLLAQTDAMHAYSQHQGLLIMRMTTGATKWTFIQGCNGKRQKPGVDMHETYHT